MNIKHRQYRAIAPGLLMLTLLSPFAVSASGIADGNYIMTIAPTPLSSGLPNFGTPGSWNSGIFFACLPGTSVCGQAMSDNGVLVGGRGSSVYEGGANGPAGTIGLNVSAGAITITSFNVDAIFNTPGGTFAQDWDLSSATGAVNSFGVMTLTPTGRWGTTDSPGTGVTGRWNVDNFTTSTNTAWTPFTSGQACNSLGCITGNGPVLAPDVNGDGLPDYHVTLVSAGYLGNDWGSAAGMPYFEIWNSQSTILSVSAVPLPGAAWLFGSGMVGLFGFMRHGRNQRNS